MEKINNPDFKVVEFDHFKNEAGLHTFTLSAKEWIAQYQMQVLMEAERIKELPEGGDTYK